MPLQYEIQQDSIAVTGYDGPVRYLQIPEEIDGLPVRRVAQSSFAHRQELLYAKLPASLRRLERFAFYGCGALEKLSLSDGITDYYDGVFPQCRSLREIELDLSGGRYVVLRELLGESDRKIRFTLHLPDGGSARLTFPEYLAEYQEDTRARAIHMHIEGAGFSYRECVSRDGINFRDYDRSFRRVRYQEDIIAAQIALDRLLMPYALEADSKEEYESYLRENAEDVIRYCLELRERDWLLLLTERNLLSEEAVQSGIRIASDSGMTELAAILMDAMTGARDSSGPRDFFEL